MGVTGLRAMSEDGRAAVRYLIGMSVACAMLTPPTSPIWAQQSLFHFQEVTIGLLASTCVLSDSLSR